MKKISGTILLLCFSLISFAQASYISKEDFRNFFDLHVEKIYSAFGYNAYLKPLSNVKKQFKTYQVQLKFFNTETQGQYSTYSGSWASTSENPDLSDDMGVALFPDGLVYIGSIKNGMLNGYGKLILPVKNRGALIQIADSKNRSMIRANIQEGYFHQSKLNGKASWRTVSGESFFRDARGDFKFRQYLTVVGDFKDHVLKKGVGYLSREESDSQLGLEVYDCAANARKDGFTCSWNKAYEQEQMQKEIKLMFGVAIGASLLKKGWDSMRDLFTNPAYLPDDNPSSFLHIGGSGDPLIFFEAEANDVGMISVMVPQDLLLNKKICEDEFSLIITDKDNTQLIEKDVYNPNLTFHKEQLPLKVNLQYKKACQGTFISEEIRVFECGKLSIKIQ